MVQSLKEYISLFNQFPMIDKVLLFGSTLTEHCTEESDIDLFFIYKGIRKDFHKMLHKFKDLYPEAYYDDLCGCDIAAYIDENSHGLLSVVKERGVLIYDRE